MSFTNINDPAGVAALLEQLKSSAAWQELAASTSTLAANGESAGQVGSEPGPSSLRPPALETPSVVDEATSEHLPEPSIIAGTSVASLLSQLQPFTTGPVDPYPSIEPSYNYENFQSSSELPRPQAPILSSHYRPAAPSAFAEERTEDRKNFTFRQSLPVISDLADDPSFVTTIKKMKKDQNELERRLWADREAIYTKYHEKLKLAQTKAQMIGTMVSQHEVTMINDAFKKELYRFDHERVVPAWDGLVTRQQNELAQVNVPTMFVTSETQDREKQQQVINVLETIVGPKIT